MSSNRTKVFASGLKNPSTKFLEWKSKDKYFSYYDKDKSLNVEVQLPLRFVVLEELSTIKGWSDSNSSGIYSNEVKFLSTQELNVKPFKGNPIAKGLYSVIKDVVKMAGGHYIKSVYVMLENGDLANIQLKGSAVQAWGEFTKVNRNKLSNQWTVIDKAIAGKKGSVTYSTPNAVLGEVLTDSEGSLADVAYNGLEAYLNAYLVKSDVVVAEAEEEALELEEELAF